MISIVVRESVPIQPFICMPIEYNNFINDWQYDVNFYNLSVEEGKQRYHLLYTISIGNKKGFSIANRSGKYEHKKLDITPDLKCLCIAIRENILRVWTENIKNEMQFMDNDLSNITEYNVVMSKVEPHAKL